MTDVAEPATPPRTKQFRRPFGTPRMPEASAERQGRVATLTYQLLGRERAIAFLNTPDPATGVTPLAAATADDAGLDAVLAAVRDAARG